jgi:hypothetical protein
MQRYDGTPIALICSKPQMSKKIFMPILAGATAGITIYLVMKMIAENQKRLLQKKANELKTMKPKTNYTYEYTL